MSRAHDVPFDAGAAIEAMAQSLLVTTTDLAAPGPRIVYANPAFERMTGWRRDEVVGRSPRLLQGPDTDRSVFEDLRASLAAGKAWVGRTANYRKDGSGFIMEWSVTPLRGTGGNVEFYVAVQRDVTAGVKADSTVANLTRYFSPAIATMLAARDAPFGPVRRQDLAVLFVDIVGFTGLVEGMAPERAIDLLRSFHDRAARQVFDNGGSIEAYVGDAVMAVFGIPEPSAADPGNALVCAQALLAEIAHWNVMRRRDRQRPLEAGLGVHFGPTVAGDVGTERCMAYTVIGDAVNTASRLQQLTRSLGFRLAVSDDLRAAALEDERETVRRAVAALIDAGPHRVKGRAEPIGVWLLR